MSRKLTVGIVLLLLVSLVACVGVRAATSVATQGEFTPSSSGENFTLEGSTGESYSEASVESTATQGDSDTGQDVSTAPELEDLPDTVPTTGTIYVFYKIEDGTFLFWCDANAQIIDNGDSWDVISDQIVAGGVNKSKVAYEIYRAEPLPTTGTGNTTVDDLELETPTGIDLPHSQHIGELTAVNPSLAKPATVVRRYMGVNYDVQCLVSQSVVNMWLSGQLQVGDFVIVSFIDEIPGTTEVNLAIVVDKVYKSW